MKWPFSKKIEPPKPKPKKVAHRAYDAASRGRLSADWLTSSINPNQNISSDLATIRARSRERYQNDDYAKRFIMLCKDKVVGPEGVVIRPKFKNPTGELDVELVGQFVEIWEDFTRKENCDFFGQQSLVEIQKAVVSSVIMDGEAFVLLENTGKYNFQIRLIDANLCPLDYNARLTNGSYVQNGIEFDSLGRVTGFYFKSLKSNNSTIYGYETLGTQYIRYGLDKVLHIFVKEFISQVRGVPWMVTSLKRLKMLDGYEEAALVAARVGASKMGFISSPDDQSPSDTFEENEEQITEVEPGMIGNLINGQTFSSFNPDYPHAQYPDFVKASLRGVAAGLGVNYTTLTGDLEATSYSSIRTGTLEERDVWKGFQAWLINGFCRPVYEKWLFQALSWGQISFASITDYERFSKVTFWPRRWPWVDPLKEVEGEEKSINLGLKSRSSVIRDMGADPLVVWEEIAFERKLLDTLGLEDLYEVPEPKVVTPDANKNSDAVDNATQAEESDDKPLDIAG